MTSDGGREAVPDDSEESETDSSLSRAPDSQMAWSTAVPELGPNCVDSLQGPWRFRASKVHFRHRR